MAEGKSEDQGLGEGGEVEEGEENNPLLERHRRETKELRATIQSLKKSVPKGDKKRKKEVSLEIAKLEQALQEKHERELAAARTHDKEGSQRLHGDGGGGGVEMKEEGGEEEDQSPAIGGSAGKRSRAQKRQEKKAQREREKEQRIAKGEAVASLNNPRLSEREKLTSILQPLGLAVKDIPPDGHCLYAAVSDQLSVRLGIKATIQELRVQCAGYIHSHASTFLPFLTDPETGSLLTQEQFAHYCREVESTATWGGQLEVRALSHVYKVPVKVYQADTPVLCIGEEYATSDIALCISYHCHEYGLGEHYNSLLPS